MKRVACAVAAFLSFAALAFLPAAARWLFAHWPSWLPAEVSLVLVLLALLVLAIAGIGSLGMAIWSEDHFRNG
jgi:hypothetical protein